MIHSGANILMAYNYCKSKGIRPNVLKFMVYDAREKAVNNFSTFKTFIKSKIVDFLGKGKIKTEHYLNLEAYGGESTLTLYKNSNNRGVSSLHASERNIISCNNGAAIIEMTDNGEIRIERMFTSITLRYNRGLIK